MIVVVGEALVDLVIDPQGNVTAALGGAPFNTARACGRLGVDVAFVGAISVDRFGSMLAAQLEADGVSTAHLARCDAPTTLAAAELDDHGAASYRFYIEGTSAPTLTAAAGTPDPSVLFTGGLGLVLEPMAATVESLVTAAPRGCLVMVDVNCRPAIVSHRDAYLDRVGHVLARADIVKVSQEDLAYMLPGVETVDAAGMVLELGPRAVLVTAGSLAVHVLARDGHAKVAVPSVDVVDTIGAGDAFGGGLIAWWQASGGGIDDLGKVEALVPAVEAAVEVAGITCTRRGAEPPWRHELPDTWSR